MMPETNAPSRSRVYVAVIFFLWLAAYGSALFSPALLDDADSVHAEAAREILIRHDWVTLHINGIRYLEKAPLLYWCIAASFRIFGVHDWSARLPLALGVLALLYSVFFLGRRFFGESAGFYSSLAAGFALGPYLFTRFLIPDIFVGLWLILSLGFFLQSFAEPQPSRFSCWGFAAACALNVLTKGLIGLVFPLAAIGLYLVMAGQARYVAKLRPWSSSFIFFAIAAPWHILAGIRNPSQGSVRGFFWFYFVNEHFLRYLNKRVPRDYGTVPLLLFWGLLFVWLFPWSAFLPQSLANVKLLRIHDAAASAQERAKIIFFLGAFFVVLFFSFSTRQEYYVLPALPALALLLGAWLGEEEEAPPGSSFRKWGRTSTAILAILGLAVGIICFVLVITAPSVAPGTDIADLLSSGLAESRQYALSLGHFLDLNLRVMGVFRAPLLLFGLSFSLGSVLSWYFRRRGLLKPANWSLVLMTAAMLLAIHSALVTFSPLLSSKFLADAILHVYQPGDVIEINGEYEGGSTLNYYTGQPVRILNGRSANLWYGSQFSDAPQVFDDSASFPLLWAGPRRVFLWTEIESKDRALAGIDPSTVYLLSRSGGKLVLTNRPVE